MWVSVALVKFHWLGIDWHVFNQSECRNCCLYVVIQKIAPQGKSGNYFQIWFFPRFGGKKWRRPEHAHASYPGLFFRPPGLSPYIGREERRVQGLDYPSGRGQTPLAGACSQAMRAFALNYCEDSLVPPLVTSLATYISDKKPERKKENSGAKAVHCLSFMNFYQELSLSWGVVWGLSPEFP